MKLESDGTSLHVNYQLQPLNSSEILILHDAIKLFVLGSEQTHPKFKYGENQVSRNLAEFSTTAKESVDQTVLDEQSQDIRKNLTKLLEKLSYNQRKIFTY